MVDSSCILDWMYLIVLAGQVNQTDYIYLVERVQWKLYKHILWPYYVVEDNKMFYMKMHIILAVIQMEINNQTVVKQSLSFIQQCFPPVVL